MGQWQLCGPVVDDTWCFMVAISGPETRSPSLAARPLRAMFSGVVSSSSSGGARVFAPSQDTGPNVRVCTYNIGAQNLTSMQGKAKEAFAETWSTDLQQLTHQADILCIQEISEFWAEFMQQETKWPMTWCDKKAFCWRRDVVQYKKEEWKRVFPESDAGVRRMFRGCFWAHCVLWAISSRGWPRGFPQVALVGISGPTVRASGFLRNGAKLRDVKGIFGGPSSWARTQGSPNANLRR